jgi:hypothetical protein
LVASTGDLLDLMAGLTWRQVARVWLIDAQPGHHQCQ